MSQTVSFVLIRTPLNGLMLYDMVEKIEYNENKIKVLILSLDRAT